DLEPSGFRGRPPDRTGDHAPSPRRQGVHHDALTGRERVGHRRIGLVADPDARLEGPGSLIGGCGREYLPVVADERPTGDEHAPAGRLLSRYDGQVLEPRPRQATHIGIVSQDDAVVSEMHAVVRHETVDVFIVAGSGVCYEVCEVDFQLAVA